MEVCYGDLSSNSQRKAEKLRHNKAARVVLPRFSAGKEGSGSKACFNIQKIKQSKKEPTKIQQSKKVPAVKEGFNQDSTVEERIKNRRTIQQSKND
jgi:hypothetical protein